MNFRWYWCSRAGLRRWWDVVRQHQHALKGCTWLGDARGRSSSPMAVRASHVVNKLLALARADKRSRCAAEGRHAWSRKYLFVLGVLVAFTLNAKNLVRRPNRTRMVRCAKDVPPN